MGKSEKTTCRDAVECRDLSIGHRDGKPLFRHLDLTLPEGKVTSLLGVNGSGKSTLIKTICGFIPPAGGEIFIAGRPLHAYSREEMARTVGVVLTERSAEGGLTVYETVSLGRYPYTDFFGRMKPEDVDAVERALEETGITDKRDCYLSRMSDGERQKVMIAKALAQETPIIFLDEPTAFLDYPSKVEIMQLLQRLAREKGKTVFLSTHDLELALQIADKVWLLDKPHGVTIGTPEDLALNDDMSRYFYREGVEFDRESGLFKISHKLDQAVRLIGEGARYNMVKKALARQGIDVVDADDCDVEIETTDNCYIMNGKEVPSIEMLLDMLNLYCK